MLTVSKKSMKNKFIVVSPKMEKHQHLVVELVHISCFILPPTDHHLKLIEQEQLLKNMTEHVLPYWKDISSKVMNFYF